MENVEDSFVVHKEEVQDLFQFSLLRLLAHCFVDLAELDVFLEALFQECGCVFFVVFEDRAILQEDSLIFFAVLGLEDRLDLLESLLDQDSIQEDVGVLETTNFELRREEDLSFLLHKVKVVVPRWNHLSIQVDRVVNLEEGVGEVCQLLLTRVPFSQQHLMSLHPLGHPVVEAGAYEDLLLVLHLGCLARVARNL